MDAAEGGADNTGALELVLLLELLLAALDGRFAAAWPVEKSA